MVGSRRARAWVFGVFVFVLAACSDGGCSGCEGCGVAAIPGGYPLDDRIANATQLRLTDTGIAFLENNADSLAGLLAPDGLVFDVPRTETTISVDLLGGPTDVDVVACPDSNCVVQAEITSLEITPTPEHRLSIRPVLLVQTYDDTGARRPLPIQLRGGCTGFGCLIDSTCQADIDTSLGSRPGVGIIADLDFLAETELAREGYTRLEIVRAELDPDAELENEDVNFGMCSGLTGVVINMVASQLTPMLLGQLQDQLNGLLQDQLGGNTCMKRGELGCPDGTFAVPDPDDPDSTCRFADADDARCVDSLIGMDGQGDIGAGALGGFSPGVHGFAQLLFAMGGDGEVVNDGMSFSLFGGFRGTDPSFETAPAHSSCVPVVDPPELPEVAFVDAFRANAAPGGLQTHVGIGIAEDYLNHVGYHAFDSGMLCLGIGTPVSQQLSSGLFSVLVRSLNALTFPNEVAPIAIALRPQNPPTFEVGNAGTDEPVLTVALPGLAMDFYVFSTERYIRFMTYQADLTLSIDLTVEDGELVPVIGDILAENSSVTNIELLNESPETLAEILQSILSSFASMLSNSIGGFALPDVGGLQLEVPEGGILGIDDGGEELLGIFANFAPPPPATLTAVPDTRLRITNLRVDPRALAAETWGQGAHPTADLFMEATGRTDAQFEYSYRIDKMGWSPWSRDSHAVLDDGVLLLQARHEVEARARVVGSTRAVDPTPAKAELIIDVLSPDVVVEQTGARVELRTRDIITPRERLEYRTRIDDGTWSNWERVGAGVAFVPLADTREVRMEVRDEAGNVGSASAALIRGRPNPAADGCSCSVPGAPRTGGPLAWLALLGAALGWGLRRRARRRPDRRQAQTRKNGSRLRTLLLSLVLALGGCSCNDSHDPMMDVDAGPACQPACEADPESDIGTSCCESNGMCVSHNLVDLCEGAMICSGHDAVTADEACAPSCTNCIMPPPLDPGMLATYLDVALTPEGGVVVSGFGPGTPGGNVLADLVVGTASSPSADLSWEIVDGPPNGPTRNDPTGWRRGVVATGEDVGRWTSVATTGSVHYVSYYDRTHGALKLARWEGGSWATHTITDVGDSGRYSAIALHGGNPVVAFMQITPPAMAPGRPIARLQVAMASNAAPASDANWTVTTLHEVELDCRAPYCGDGQQCLDSGQCVVPSGDCATETCAEGQACWMGSCQALIDDPYVEDMPPGTGLYNQLVPTADGLALAFYDRATGNLRGARFDGSAWSAPVLIDGWARSPDAGDAGMSASLFVDADGVWHLAYVDGANEALKYARMEGDTVTVELVDDGRGVGDTPNTDGRHIVGDDASIVVAPDGEIRIVYQDATVQRALMATKPADGAWTLEVIDDQDQTGFWLEQVLDGSTSHIFTLWRREQGGHASGLRVL